MRETLEATTPFFLAERKLRMERNEKRDVVVAMMGFKKCLGRQSRGRDAINAAWPVKALPH